MKGKHHLFLLTASLVCPLSVHAGSGAVPDLQMYIFEENNDNPAESNKPLNTSGGNGQMKMVIFSDSPEVQNTVSQVPVSHGRAISISSDNQVAVQTEQNKANDLYKSNYQMEYYVNGGYQHNDFDWNIASPTGYPNILSELKWNDIESAMFKTGMTFTFIENWYADVKLGYGEVMGGSNQDSDYYLNNRQGEFSRSNNNSDDGYLFDASGALGYHVHIRNKDSTPVIRLTPKVGYAYHEQEFNITDGFQTIPAYGSFAGLDSTYDASWYGFWSGFETRFLVSDRFSLRSSFEYHWMDYYGKGNWNLRDEFQHPKSFTQSADGDGIVTSASAQYLFMPNWAITLNLNYQQWNAENDGIDKTYLSNGYVGETKYNEMNSYSYGVNMGVEYSF